MKIWFAGKDRNYERRQSNLKVILTLATFFLRPHTARNEFLRNFILPTSFSSSEKLAKLSIADNVQSNLRYIILTVITSN